MIADVDDAEIGFSHQTALKILKERDSTDFNPYIFKDIFRK